MRPGGLAFGVRSGPAHPCRRMLRRALRLEEKKMDRMVNLTMVVGAARAIA